MKQNKKGLSEAVMTVIMIALVLVAVGVIWVVVQNILSKSATNIDYNQKCLGITIEPTNLEPCDANNCNVALERATGSTGDAVGGFEVTLSNETASGTAQTFDENVAVSMTKSVTKSVGNPNKVSVRIYFIDDKSEKHYCNNIFVYPKA